MGETAVETKGLASLIERTLGLSKSWVGLTAAYIAALVAASAAFQKLPEPLKSAPLWLRITVAFALPLCALLFQGIPELVERSRRKHLTEITGKLQTGYFQLGPREDEATYTRVDGAHQEVLRWIERHPAPILYLTGLSGSGKSSLLAAHVVPTLLRTGTVVIRLRGYQDPVEALEEELLRPGVIWQKPPTESAGLNSLLERACRYLRPRRLLVVLDQFEEFVILQQPAQQQRFEQWIASLQQLPETGLALLFVFRSDYIGLIERLALPPLIQNTNWKEVPPFTENAARDFIQGSGLQVGDDLLRDVLREAAEIEQTKGIIRPVTINLCGLVLGRFATGLPRGFRPSQLIRGFLRESILLPEIRDIAPTLVPHLVSGYVTKRPRTIAGLAADTSNDPAVVRGCLRVLGRSDRAIVRPLDLDQQTWEVSHDFLVPHLDAITARWRVSLSRNLRPWLPWLAATAMLLTTVVIASSRRGRDPILDLGDMGWQMQSTAKGLELEFDGPPPQRTLAALQRTSRPLFVSLSTLDNANSLSGWSVLRNLASLNLNFTHVGDLSPLRNLKSLTSLDLDDTSARDASPLKGLTHLTSLDLRNTSIQDVSPLKGLTHLTSLLLGGTQVSDLSPLRSLKDLTLLDLGGTEVSDLSPLKELNDLNSLDLDNTRVSDLSPLKGLRKLTKLHLEATNISDNVPPWDGLPNLTKLYLRHTQVYTVAAMRGLRELIWLDLSETQVHDLSPLRNLRNLRVLELDKTEANLSSLDRLTSLQVLSLRDSKVSDISSLTSLVKLRSLNLSGTSVNNLSPLKSLTNLKELDVSNTKVKDLSPLKGLTHLTSLTVSGLEGIDMSPVQGSKSLQITK